MQLSTKRTNYRFRHLLRGLNPSSISEIFLFKILDCDPFPYRWYFLDGTSKRTTGIARWDQSGE